MENNLKLIVLESAKELGESVNKHLMERRNVKESFILPIEEIRFQNGEGKIVLNESIRGCDLYILSDVNNHDLTYKLYDHINHYSPDDHFMDIERVISAIRGHTNNITVVMPLLYSSRQHRRKERESLDCAIALQKLYHFYNVKRMLTIDAHSLETVTNAVPLAPYESMFTTGLILENFLKEELKNIDLNNLLIVAPDSGATNRANFYSSVFKCPLGLFEKQRDYKVKNGKNQINSSVYAGPDVKGKDVIVVDDMVSSGGSLLSVAKQLNERGAKNIYFITTFALFTEGIKEFNEYYQKGYFTKYYTTNFTYIKDEYKKLPWLNIVDGSESLAKLIDELNKNQSIADLIDEKQKVAQLIEEEKQGFTRKLKK